MTVDWGDGRYEVFAQQLLPAAEVVVDAASVAAGQRLLDVGCGTGNAALLAAARGATVTAVDPAPRLLEVAADRARTAGVEVELLVGEAAAPPVPEASYDVVVSVFAAVFAPDPRAALEGMVRALAPDGRIVLTAWVPGSPIAEIGRIARAEAAATPPAPPFPWHEVSHVRQLAATMELEVEVQQHELAFVAASPEAYLAAELEHHPATRATRAALERAGRFEAVRRSMLDVLTAGNEDPDRFRVTSRYLVYTLRRRVEAGRG